MDRFCKNKKVIWGIAIALLIAIILVIFFFSTEQKYTDTHARVTLRINEEVESDTSDVFTYDEEFVQGDTLYLHATKVVIEDISQDGTVKLSFQPEVISSLDGETVSSISIRYRESFDFIENCVDKESASAQIYVVGKED